MNKLIAAAVTAGVFGAGLTMAVPAAAAPNCSDIVDQINNDDYTPTTGEKWTCAAAIQANKWETFPQRTIDKWTKFPGDTAEKWATGGGIAEKWASFPDKLRDKWTPGGEE